MVYIDREIAPSIQQRDEQQQAQGLEDFRAAPVDMFAPVHPLYTDLRRALIRYKMRWGSLPQVEIPSGPALKLNATGDRVALLRQRLGLSEGAKFDAGLAGAVKEFQEAHGMKGDGIAGAGTIAALKSGLQALREYPAAQPGAGSPSAADNRGGPLHSGRRRIGAADDV